MITNILNDIKSLQNEKNIQKLLKQDITIECYGVAIGELKKLIRKYKINKNNDLANELYLTNVYDAMQLACMIVDTKKLDYNVLNNWLEKTTFYPLIIDRLIYICAENPNYEFFINKYQLHTTDTNSAIHLAIIYGRCLMDPEFNKEYINDAISFLNNELTSTNYEKSVVQGFYFLSFVGTQVKGYDKELITIYEKLNEYYTISMPTLKHSDSKTYILNTINNNRAFIKRDHCRC